MYAKKTAHEFYLQNKQRRGDKFVSPTIFNNQDLYSLAETYQCRETDLYTSAVEL